MWELIRKDQSVQYSVVTPTASYYKARVGGRIGSPKLICLNGLHGYHCHFLQFKNLLANNQSLGWRPSIV